MQNMTYNVGIFIPPMMHSYLITSSSLCSGNNQTSSSHRDQSPPPFFIARPTRVIEQLPFYQNHSLSLYVILSFVIIYDCPSPEYAEPVLHSIDGISDQSQDNEEDNDDDSYHNVPPHFELGYVS